jgi:hypothetical protein
MYMCIQDLYQHVDLKVRAFLTDRIVAPLLNPDLVGPQLVVAFSQAWEHSKKLAKCVKTVKLNARIPSGYMLRNESSRSST